MAFRPPLSASEHREVVALYLAGYSSRRVAKLFGITHQTVINHVRAAGAHVRFKGLRAHPIRVASATDPTTAGPRMIPVLTTAELPHALNLWARGVYTTADIAKILCVSEPAVANSIGRFHGFTQGRAA